MKKENIEELLDLESVEELKDYSLEELNSLEEEALVFIADGQMTLEIIQEAIVKLRNKDNGNSREKTTNL